MDQKVSGIKLYLRVCGPGVSQAQLVMFNVLSNTLRYVSPDRRLSNFTSFGNIGGFLMNLAIGAAFSISIITLGYSALQFVMSAGNPKNIKKAWSAFLWSAIAAMIALGALGIKLLIVRGFGVTAPDITNNVPSF